MASAREYLQSIMATCANLQELSDAELEWGRESLREADALLDMDMGQKEEEEK